MASITASGSYLKLLPTGGGVTSELFFEVGKPDPRNGNVKVRRFSDSDRLGVEVYFDNDTSDFFPWARVDHLHRGSTR